MPVLNDFGEAGYQRVVAQVDAFADRLGIQREVIRQYVNDTGHLPQTLGELETWGNTPDRVYGVRRRQPNGAWTPLMPGPTPGTGGPNDPGFRHVISNRVDLLERFLDVDPSGNIWGGSWDPAYNAAHPNAGSANPDMLLAEATARTPGGRQAQARPFDPRNYVAPVGDPSGPYVSVVDGVPNVYPTQAEAEQDYNRRTGDTGAAPAAGTGAPPAAAPPSAPPGGSPPPGAPPGGPPPRGARPAASPSSGLAPLVDAAAYGNTQTLQAQIDDAIRRYALARTAEERNQAYLDLQRWQTELGKAQNDQQRYDAMAQALLSASVQLQNNPRDWVKFNQYTSGGRDIFAQMQQAGPAFAGPTGPIEPGSVTDLLSRLGITPGPKTPDTPAGVQPGAANPHNPELPNVPVPGSAGGPPGALQPGAGGAPAPGAAPGALPSYEEMLAGLDAAAGGHWGGNRTDRQTVAREWWNANPARRNQPMPAWS